ncbi:MAG TPA: hypothetical protein VHY91_05475 [Pirellulales bacterium]|jgi:hypothetical protein|nr:hypothetical protein [Pirellulales bacterium]
MIFRLSQKLNAKIKAGDLPALPLDENPFADWSAHLFVANRTQYILLSNTKSLYSVVIYGKGITDEGRFIERAVSSLREFMRTDEQDFILRRFIVAACATVRFAKALDRAVTGSMNELVFESKMMLGEHDLSPFKLGFRLNDTLLSAIAPSKAEKYGKPREAFRALAESIEP